MGVGEWGQYSSLLLKRPKGGAGAFNHFNALNRGDVVVVSRKTKLEDKERGRD